MKLSRRRWLAAVSALSVGVAGCSGDDSGDPTTDGTTTDETTDGTTTDGTTTDETTNGTTTDGTTTDETTTTESGPPDDIDLWVPDPSLLDPDFAVGIAKYDLARLRNADGIPSEAIDDFGTVPGSWISQVGIAEENIDRVYSFGPYESSPTPAVGHNAVMFHNFSLAELTDLLEENGAESTGERTMNFQVYRSNQLAIGVINRIMVLARSTGTRSEREQLEAILSTRYGDVLSAYESRESYAEFRNTFGETDVGRITIHSVNEQGNPSQGEFLRSEFDACSWRFGDASPARLVLQTSGDIGETEFRQFAESADDVDSASLEFSQGDTFPRLSGDIPYGEITGDVRFPPGFFF